MKRIGVLGFQGSVDEHLKAIERVGHFPLLVREKTHLKEIDGLILPGGESTTFLKLLHTSGLYEPLLAGIKEGLPVLATCAGLIVLASKVSQPEQASMALLDISVQRNGYGSQYESFCEEVKVEGFKKTFRAVFIRAPLIQSVGPGVSILSVDHAGHPVFVQQEHLWGLTFHPELTQDDRIHELFCSNISNSGLRRSKDVRTFQVA